MTETPSPRGVVRWQLLLLVCLGGALLLPLLGSSTLWDPWEGHYAEVARRMLEEQDWLRMRWQNEPFFSKPVLTFWLMAGSLKIFGVAGGGGYSGEMVASHMGEWALRLPFALFGLGGLIALWVMLARLVSRRAAWLATAVVATTPFYAMVSRQAITDMPSVAMLIGSISLFAIAMFEDHEHPPKGLFGTRVTHVHVFAAALALLVFPQLIYTALHTRGLKYPLGPRTFVPGPLAMVPLALGTLAVIAWVVRRTQTTRQVLMYWFYLLAGLAVLSKGPVAPALAGLTILTYLILTGEWERLRRCEIPKGVLIALAICVPWHVAMYVKDGSPFVAEYFNQHLLNRAFKGTHGDRGTYRYFLGQLGIGMWPWVALVPIALGRLLTTSRALTSEARARLFIGIWAIVGFFFFAMVTTKFHHYVLPAVPALAALVGLWLDDVLRGEVRWARVGVLVGLGLFVLTALDLIPNQQKLTQLFIYRYDRSIPRGAPFFINYDRVIWAFALLFGAGLVAILVRHVRKPAVIALCAVAAAWAVFTTSVLMTRAAPHYGQRSIWEIYYRERTIYGVELDYGNAADLVDDWGTPRELEVRALIPRTMKVGDPMRVGWRLQGNSLNAGELRGAVAKIDDAGHRFWIGVPEAERAKVPLDRMRAQPAVPGARRWMMVDAERVISKLYWRGESWYANGEIWHSHWDKLRAVFHELNDADNKRFLEYLKQQPTGRRLWIAAEKAHLAGVKGLLPTETGKKTFTEYDASSSFFGLASFVP